MPVKYLALIVVTFLASPSARASEAPKPEDVKAVEACLTEAASDRESCVGKLTDECRDGPPAAQSTPQVTECGARERMVWEAMVEDEIALLSKGSIGQTKAEPWNRPAEPPRKAAVQGREIIADMDKSWRLFRTLKCDMESLQAEGGSYGRILYGSCMMKEAGRHALWLRALREEVESH